MNAANLKPKQEVTIINDCYGFKAGDKVNLQGEEVNLGVSEKTVLVQKGIGTGLYVDLDNIE